MENILESLPGWLTSEWAAAFVFNVILLIVLYARSKADTRPSPKSGTDYPQAGITIINNAPGCCAPRRHRKTVRRRRVGSTARRRPLHCRSADRNEV